MALNEDIIDYIRQQENAKVGDKGECWDLAEEALKDAGAKTSRDFGKITHTADYKWGTAVKMEQAMPGDIIQFKNHIIVHKKIKEDGSGIISTSTTDHHTAVVLRIIDRGQGIIEVYEQNANNVRFVKKGKYYFKSVKFENTEGGEKIKHDITVSGQVKFYHPQVKARK